MFMRSCPGQWARIKESISPDKTLSGAGFSTHIPVRGRADTIIDSAFAFNFNNGTKEDWLIFNSQHTHLWLRVLPGQKFNHNLHLRRNLIHVPINGISNPLSEAIRRTEWQLWLINNRWPTFGDLKSVEADEKCSENEVNQILNPIQGYGPVLTW